MNDYHFIELMAYLGGWYLVPLEFLGKTYEKHLGAESSGLM